MHDGVIPFAVPQSPPPWSASATDDAIRRPFCHDSLALTKLPAWRIAEIPRPRDAGHDGGARDTGAVQRVQALVSASGGREPVAIAWVRERAGGPVTVLAVGPALPGVAQVLGQVQPAGLDVCEQRAEQCRRDSQIPSLRGLGVADTGSTAGRRGSYFDTAAV
jgi:hypothetical protein